MSALNSTKQLDINKERRKIAGIIAKSSAWLLGKRALKRVYSQACDRA